MSDVRLENVRKDYADFVAVDGIDLHVKEGEFVTLLGESGCGKTTTLRLIAGFVRPDSGFIKISGTDVSKVPAYKRNIGVVFQNYALFPHMTVSQNVGYGLTNRTGKRDSIAQRIAEALKLTQLESLANRYPRQLSGGQQQRVALARAVAIRPDILLLDEPLGALDLKLRQELQTHIKDVQKTLGITTLYITHDQGEALSLSDRVAVMKRGRILQCDTPFQIYSHPTSNFVARFVGRTNSIPVEIQGMDTDRQKLSSSFSDARLFAPNASTASAPGSEANLCVRPERLKINRECDCSMPAKVTKVDYYGSNWLISAAVDNRLQLLVELSSCEPVPKINDAIRVGWKISDSILLPRTDP